uniref:ATP-dependent 6-phosphofructokinase n=1 Tax=Magnetococcus massalia (strain MO-1) TaxID=451514 RepID=A0A1S7LMD9_MAGMO|nr:6-phosphofructokinase [Candidatus Magnetococcus massalia]
MHNATPSMQAIAVMTSGGDAPGMNSAIRSVVRTALGKGLDVYGIQRGYTGLLEGDIFSMDASSVGNIIQKGGTILGTSRCPEFHEPEIRKEAANILKRKKIDGLVVIGGNGSFNGAQQLSSEHSLPVAAIPGTIDNDIENTCYTIGFDTAVETAVNAVDKIRDTANAHERIFIVEVMGRSSHAIAVHTGVCTGAEQVITNVDDHDFEALAQKVRAGRKRGKRSFIFIIAERDQPGHAYAIKEKLQQEYALSSHVSILGHLQRGGSPTAHDRYLASVMGYRAVEALVEGHQASVTALRNGQVVIAPLADSLAKRNHVEGFPLKLTHRLSI